MSFEAKALRRGKAATNETPSPPSDGGEGRGEEARLLFWNRPHSSAHSCVVGRGRKPLGRCRCKAGRFLAVALQIRRRRVGENRRLVSFPRFFAVLFPHIATAIEDFREARLCAKRQPQQFDNSHALRRGLRPQPRSVWVPARRAAPLRTCMAHFLLFSAALGTHAAEIPKAPVPKSPYIAVVYRYADTMLEKGLDTHGPQKTGLFLSALDRTTLAPMTNRPAAPSGVREGDRVGAPNGPLFGANPQHDENLFRLLYLLSDLSAKPRYRDAAN